MTGTRRSLGGSVRMCGLSRPVIALGTGGHVRVEGKGRKQRAVPLTKEAKAVLTTWLAERDGQPQDPLFRRPRSGA